MTPNEDNCAKNSNIYSVLIIDERSLLTSKLFGSTAQILSETIFQGGISQQIIGALPVLVLVGDDYQLPSMSEGALDVLFRAFGSKMTQKGRQLFKDLLQKFLNYEQFDVSVMKDKTTKNYCKGFDLVMQ